MKPLKIGIIGLGAIGSRLVEILSREFHRQGRIAFLCDLREEKILQIQKQFAPHARALGWQKLVASSDLVIEAASQEMAFPVTRRALRHGKQVLILSVGGLLEARGLSSLLEKTKGRLWIPSGALAGIDGILAASAGTLRQVTLTTRKPVRGLEGAPYLREKGICLDTIQEPTLIFEGNALEAIRAFPKNVNVAATLALAGLGAERTRVRVFASPTYRENQHEVVAEGDFGTLRVEVKNRPSATNPRTSELAILSAVATLRKIFSRIHLGS